MGEAGSHGGLCLTVLLGSTVIGPGRKKFSTRRQAAGAEAGRDRVCWKMCVCWEMVLGETVLGLVSWKR